MDVLELLAGPDAPRAAVVAAGVLLALELLLWLGPRLSLRLAPRFGHHAWAASFALLAFLLADHLPAEHPLARAVEAACLVLTGYVLFGLLDLLVLQRPWNPKRGPMMPRLARAALGLVLFAVVAFVAATWILELKLTALVAGSTVLTAVLGFALQDLLKDAVAGVALQSERPFAIGDWLLLDDGTPVEVLEMSWRATQLRTVEGVLIFEPNARLAQARIHVYASGRKFAWILRYGLPYDAAPARVRAILLDAVRSSPGVLGDPPPQVFLESYGDSSVVYRVRAWTENLGEILSFADALNSRAWYAFSRAGISFPFPTRTVNLHQAADATRERRASDLARVEALLGSVDLFAQLGPEALRALAQGAARQHHDAGERLVREGEEADSLYLLESGRVAVRKETPGAAPLELARLGPGELFGEASLLTGEPRMASVVALEGCEVIVIGRAALAPILSADPSLAEGLSRTLAARVAATARQVEDRRRVSEPAVESTILSRIRALFGLHG